MYYNVDEIYNKYGKETFFKKLIKKIFLILYFVTIIYFLATTNFSILKSVLIIFGWLVVYISLFGVVTFVYNVLFLAEQNKIVYKYRDTDNATYLLEELMNLKRTTTSKYYILGWRLNVTWAFLRSNYYNETKQMLDRIIKEYKNNKDLKVNIVEIRQELYKKQYIDRLALEKNLFWKKVIEEKLDVRANIIIQDKPILTYGRENKMAVYYNKNEDKYVIEKFVVGTDKIIKNYYDNEYDAHEEAMAQILKIVHNNEHNLGKII